MIEILLTALAVFGLSVLLVEYEGPAYLFERLRRIKWLPFRCTVCTACWIALPIAFISGIGIVGYLSVIGLVILTERLT